MEQYEKETNSKRLLNAILSKNLVVSENLLLDNIDPNYKPSAHGHTPLSQAIEVGSIEIVQLILDHKSTDPDKQGYDGMTPLTLAISTGSIPLVSLLLEDPRTSVNLKEAGGLTPLCLAVSMGNKEAVGELIKKEDIDVNLACDGKTGLEMAEEGGLTEIIKMLKDAKEATV